MTRALDHGEKYMANDWYIIENGTDKIILTETWLDSVSKNLLYHDRSIHVPVFRD